MEKAQKVVALALPLNSKGELLISRRNDDYTPDAHNKWALVGGKVEYGEDPADTVKREMIEETGMEITELKLLPKVFTQFWNNKHNEEYQVLLLSYKCKVVDESKLHITDPKIAELKFVTIEDAKNYDFLPLDLEIIELLKS